MRLHRNLVLAVLDGLHLICNEKAYADKVIQQLLKRDKRWGARDRSFIAETTYDIIRWKRLYATIGDVKEPFSRDDQWRLFCVWATLKGIRLPDWKQTNLTPTRRIKGKYDEFRKIRKLRDSVPDWIDALGEQQLGGLWDTELSALNQKASVILRTNTLKITKQALQKVLEKEEIYTKFVQNRPDALELVERKNVFQTEAFKNGWFEVQDASSQWVAKFLDVKPGQKVIDTCAGAGGKSLHLAALMQNKGQIIAMDIYISKLKELKKRAQRAGVHNIETRLIESSKDIKKLHQKADRVLIDAPCSGLGVLKRNPDTKWKLTRDRLDKIMETQSQILENYSKMVKPEGKMVYATCSMLPMENQDQVKSFLASEAGSEFTLVKDKKILASQSGYDGFYMALLVRK